LHTTNIGANSPRNGAKIPSKFESISMLCP
jgi:hypothetical protein